MSTKFLVPTDLSPNSLPALELAVALADPLDGVLELLYVVDTGQIMPFPAPAEVDPATKRDEMLAQAMMALDEVARRESIGSAVLTCHTRLGLPWQEIVAHAALEKVDMIVMATHGRTGLSHALIGSTAERVLRGAPCPILTVRTGGRRHRDEGGQDEAGEAGAHRLVTHPPRHLLVPTDLTEGSLTALIQAGRLANLLNADVHLVHVIDIAYSTIPLLAREDESNDLYQRMNLRAGDALREFLNQHADELSDAVVTAPALLRMGEAAREIELAALEVQADLVVIGRHGRRGVRRLLMGSVAEQVIRTAPCPVLTVPLPPEPA